MRLMITDELLDVYFDKYQDYKEIMKSLEDEKNIVDFDYFVESQSRFEAWKLRKGGFKVEVNYEI